MNWRIVSRPCLMLLLCAWCFTGCGEEVWEMDPFLVPCTGIGPMLCMSYKVDGKQRLTYQNIVGFNFQWGVKQTISVSRTEDEESTPEDPQTVLSVNQTLSKEVLPPGSTFQIPIGKYWLKKDSKGQLYLVTLPIDCLTFKTCALIEAVWKEKSDEDDPPTYLASFEYPESNTSPLVLRALKKQ